jgi:hypothetical protein
MPKKSVIRYLCIRVELVDFRGGMRGRTLVHVLRGGDVSLIGVKAASRVRLGFSDRLRILLLI